MTRMFFILTLNDERSWLRRLLRFRPLDHPSKDGEDLVDHLLVSMVFFDVSSRRTAHTGCQLTSLPICTYPPCVTTIAPRCTRQRSPSVIEPLGSVVKQSPKPRFVAAIIAHSPILVPEPIRIPAAPKTRPPEWMKTSALSIRSRYASNWTVRTALTSQRRNRRRQFITDLWPQSLFSSPILLPLGLLPYPYCSGPVPG